MKCELLIIHIILFINNTHDQIKIEVIIHKYQLHLYEMTFLTD